ncbi:MAG: hypothetical protein A2806_01530 [Candidatus Terrybacteria bacterium RIFCSPHIGHO2_01_FULL_48_17]|uniref:DNA-directed DNA polymerase n=1 Tax=Candidatus Terrybacteria bacterium RIFCSPHIGHO2_01_FULL_48_17 TaxID=1802362 RepID=A0A1G2PJ04_9BACT|nr:MAG: hypothetical protein A2806_01530 [Candidatus Terrybacteria bacterium RIFCSPHIGHO2_01_FULL_48_17]OHA52281.1 MAG: hypothetical protein A3A30_04790 [Candidatus Terrybacteria bacterium RIFCSPLOWO2_01_FULL_48_14]
MLYLLHGPNSFLRNRKLSQIIEAYQQKHPDALGFSHIDASEQGLEEFETLLAAQGLFVSSRFIIARDGLLHWGEKALVLLQEYKAAKDPAMIVVFVEEKIEKTILSLLQGVATIQEFPEPSLEGVTRFVKKEIAQRSGQVLESEALTQLASIGRNNFWRLTNILEQVLAFTYGKQKITIKDVSLFGQEYETQAIFPLGDALLSHRSLGALRFLEELVSGGEDPKGIGNYLIWLARSFAGIYAAYQEGISEVTVARTFSLHPFVARKLLSFAQLWNPQNAEEFFIHAARFDARRMRSLLPLRLAIDAWLLAAR